MSKIRIVIAEFEGDGDASLDFLAALRGALGEGADVVTLRHVEPSLPDVQPEPVRQAKSAPPAPVVYEPAQASTAAATNKAAPRRTFTADSTDGSRTVTQRVIEALGASPGLAAPALAAVVYGNALPETIRKLKFNLYALCNAGKLKRVGMGRYEVAR